MKNKNQKVCDAYWWLDSHPAFWPIETVNGVAEVLTSYDHGFVAISIDPHQINPATKCVDDNKKLNTKLQWWGEFGPAWYDKECPSASRQYSHDWKLDVYEDTYEDVLLEIARKVKRHYGDYKTDRESRTLTLTKGKYIAKFTIAGSKKVCLGGNVVDDDGISHKVKKCDEICFYPIKHIPYSQWKKFAPWLKDEK